MSAMKENIGLIFLAAAALLVSSCNTFIGMGRDIESVGVGMQNTSEGKTWYGNQKQDPQAAPAPDADY